MTPDNDTNERDRLKAANRWHRLVTPGAIGVAGLSLMMNFYQIFNERVVVTPPTIERAFWVAGGRASQEYLEDQADYVLSTLKTVTPLTVDYENKKILKMVAPERYGEIKADLDSQAIKIKADNISTVWAPQTVEVDVDGLRIIWSGVLSTYIADKKTSETNRTYLVEFDITRQGKLYVKTAGKEITREPGV